MPVERTLLYFMTLSCIFLTFTHMQTLILNHHSHLVTLVFFSFYTFSQWKTALSLSFLTFYKGRKTSLWFGHLLLTIRWLEHKFEKQPQTAKKYKAIEELSRARCLASRCTEYMIIAMVIDSHFFAYMESQTHCIFHHKFWNNFQWFNKYVAFLYFIFQKNVQQFSVVSFHPSGQRR